MKHAKTWIVGSLAALFAFVAFPAAAQETDYVDYKVKRDDTLYAIARRYLINEQSAFEVQRLNNIADARRLPINRKLRIPRRLLGYNNVELSVFAVSGVVEIARRTPQVGQTLAEGQIIQTQRNGFISFTSDFGGRISVPSSTTARLLKARRYKLGDTLDVEFEVIRGRANAISPTLQGGDSMRMRTPVAVTAVRGTDFRVGYDPDNGGASLTEVTEGAVNVAAGGQQRAAPAGFGISSSSQGVSAPEELLPAPRIINADGIQTKQMLNYTIDPIQGARGYRVQVARDISFLEIVGEKVVSGTNVELESLENRRYFVRARAIAQSGLEGENSTGAPFLRKRVGASATGGKSDFFDGYTFKWVPDGSENATFAFQLWDKRNPDVLLVDELGLTVTEIALTDLTPGQYAWRVAAIETDPQEGLVKVWGDPQPLSISR